MFLDLVNSKSGREFGTKVHVVDVDALKPRDENLLTKVIDVCTIVNVKTGRWCGCLCYVTYSLFSVPIDDYNEKMVLSVEGVRVSRHKDIHPEDSDDPADIGLSSEEEAEDMDEEPHIRRKYHQTAQPLPPEPEQPPAGGPAPSTSTGGDTATIQVPVAALQEVHRILGQIIGGEKSFRCHQQIPSLSSLKETSPFQCPNQRRGISLVSCASGNFGPLKH